MQIISMISTLQKNQSVSFIYFMMSGWFGSCLRMSNDESTGTVKSSKVDFQFRCVSAEDQIYEATGSMAPHLRYTIKYRKLLHLHLVHTHKPVEKVGPSKKAPGKQRKSHKYSSSLHFYEKADIKRICCDQLVSLELHKERSVGNKERKHMVLRRLYRIGGWVREGRNKDRIYVPPDSPLPDFLITKRVKTVQSAGGLEIGFQ